MEKEEEETGKISLKKEDAQSKVEETKCKQLQKEWGESGNLC